MLKIDILKNNVITNSAQFGTQSEADTWLSSESANGSFGKTERWVEEKNVLDGKEDMAVQLEKRTVTSIDGQSVVEYRFAPEFTIQQSDITDEVLKNDKLSLRIEKQAIGALVIAIATEINDSKNYNQLELQNILSDKQLLAIERLAWSGSLVLLKASILGYEGNYYTEEDKLELLVPINKHLGQ